MKAVDGFCVLSVFCWCSAGVLLVSAVTIVSASRQLACWKKERMVVASPTYKMAPRPTAFSPSWLDRIRNEGNKDSGLVHDLDAQQAALEHDTATAFKIWFYIMLIYFSMFVMFRYI